MKNTEYELYIVDQTPSRVRILQSRTMVVAPVKAVKSTSMKVSKPAEDVTDNMALLGVVKEWLGVLNDHSKVLQEKILLTT